VRLAHKNKGKNRN